MRTGKTGTAKEGRVNAPRFSDNHSLEASPPTTQPRVWPSGAGQHGAVPTPTSGKEGLEGSLLLTARPNTLTSDTLGQREKKKQPETLSFHLFPLILPSSYFISKSGVGASVALCSPWGRSLDSILLSIQGRQGFALNIMVALTYSHAQQICVQGMNGSMNEWINEVMKLPWVFTGPISLRSSVPILNLAAEKALLSFWPLISEIGPFWEEEIPTEIGLWDAQVINKSTRSWGNQQQNRCFKPICSSC